MTINVSPSGAVTTADGNQILSYERVGDVRNPKCPVLTHKTGDPRINQLFTRYATNANLKDNISFKLEAIEAVVGIFGNFGKFMSYQFDYNYLMHGLNLDFLEDTLRFITTGERSYSLLTWKELVAINPDYIVRANAQRRWYSISQKYGIKNNTDLKHYISMWCSQSGGFEDMLYTTWVLFGSPDGAKALKD